MGDYPVAREWKSIAPVTITGAAEPVQLITAADVSAAGGGGPRARWMKYYPNALVYQGGIGMSAANGATNGIPMQAGEWEWVELNCGLGPAFFAATTTTVRVLLGFE